MKNLPAGLPMNQQTASDQSMNQGNTININQQKQICEPVAAFKSLSINPQATSVNSNQSPPRHVFINYSYDNNPANKQPKIQHNKSQSLGNVSNTNPPTTSQANGSMYNQQSQSMLSLMLQETQAPPQQYNYQNTNVTTFQTEESQRSVLGDILTTNMPHSQSVQREPAYVIPTVNHLVNQPVSQPLNQPTNVDAWNANSHQQSPGSGDSAAIDHQPKQQSVQDYQQQAWRRSAREAL